MVPRHPSGVLDQRATRTDDSPQAEGLLPSAMLFLQSRILQSCRVPAHGATPAWSARGRRAACACSTGDRLHMCLMDDNGNLTSDGVRSYTYDHANRLTQVTQGSQTTQFAYNGDGVRTGKTVSGDTTQYVLDLAATLPVVVSDTEAVYLYGLDIIAQQQAERQHYFHDGLGSVRQLLDSTGEVQTNYAYDPFGVPVVEGDASNPYRFTGEAWDEEVELLYLRARYYQPETGRFITRDPASDSTAQSFNLDGWAYVDSNPVNRIDPTGLVPQGPGTQDFESPWAWSWWEDDRDLTLWLFRELKANVYSQEANEIRRHFASARDLLLTPWFYPEAVVHVKLGIDRWNNLVGDRCKWDFKHKIRGEIGEVIMLTHEDPGGHLGYRWYEYSTPGNVFFGWMGMSVGFPDWFLHRGAGYAEVQDPAHQRLGDCVITTQLPFRNPLTGEPETNICINPEWGKTCFDEPGDYWKVEFGIQLYKTYGPGMSYASFLSFLGSHGSMLISLSELGQAPDLVDTHENPAHPYPVGHFNGSGCTRWQ